MTSVETRIKEETLEEDVLEAMLKLETTEALCGQIIFEDSDNDLIEIAEEYETSPETNNIANIKREIKGECVDSYIKHTSPQFGTGSKQDEYLHSAAENASLDCLDDILSLLEENLTSPPTITVQEQTSTEPNVKYEIKLLPNHTIKSLLEKKDDINVNQQSINKNVSKRCPRMKVTSIRGMKRHRGKMEAMKQTISSEDHSTVPIAEANKSLSQLNELDSSILEELKPTMHCLLEFIQNMSQFVKKPYNRMKMEEYFETQKSVYYEKCYPIVNRIILPMKRNNKFIEDLIMLMAREATFKNFFNVTLHVLKKSLLDLIQWADKKNHNIENCKSVIFKGITSSRNNIHYRNDVSSSNNVTNIIGGTPGHEIRISYNRNLLNNAIQKSVANEIYSNKEPVTVSEMQNIVTTSYTNSAKTPTPRTGENPQMYRNYNYIVPTSMPYDVHSRENLRVNGQPPPSYQQSVYDKSYEISNQNPQHDVQRNFYHKIQYYRDKTIAPGVLERSISRDSGFLSPTSEVFADNPSAIQQEMPFPIITNVSSTSIVATEQVKSRCLICNKQTNKRCLGCYSVYYCSSDCQSVHWVVHKIYCRSQC